jgi:hypothetical protein
MKLRLILFAAAAVFIATGAQAQLVVGTDDSPFPIYHVDVGTGIATEIYSGPEGETWGMAYDPNTNTLYWNAGVELYSSQFSMAGLTPQFVGNITYQGANSSMVSLAFRGGKLLATKNISVEAVYEIDPLTAEATLLYQYDSLFDFGGIGVDVTTTLLFGLSDATGGGQGRGCYEIDTNAMMTTFRAPYPAGETDIDGLAVNDGLAYYVIDQPGLFYIYDVNTGNQVGTLDSPFTTSAIFSGAAWVTGGPISVEQTSWGSLKNMYR